MTTPRTARRVLVTGGAGFIGGHLVRHLVSMGFEVVVIDDLSTGQRSNLEGIGQGSVDLLEGTVGELLTQTMSSHDFAAIYHLAAAVGVKLVVDEPIHCIENNVHETSVLLSEAARADIPVLLASTSEIYGKSEAVPFSEGDDVVYGSSLEPRWSYAYSKAIDEHLALAWHRSAGLHVVIARFFNTVGPRQRGRWGMVLPRFVRCALSGEPLMVHGDGLQSRCFCDVRDVVPVLPQLLNSSDARGCVVNVGRDESITIKALAELVVATLESSSEIRFVSTEEDYGRSIEDLRRRQPDITRLKALTGFTPTHTLEQTIHDTAVVMRAEMART